MRKNDDPLRRRVFRPAPARSAPTTGPSGVDSPRGNMAAKSEQRLPDSADCTAENDAWDMDLRSTKNGQVGCQAWPSYHRVARCKPGKVLLGTLWEDGKDACFSCLDEETGRLLGFFIGPRPRRGDLEKWAISFHPHG